MEQDTKSTRTEKKSLFLGEKEYEEFCDLWQAGPLIRQDYIEDILGRFIEQDELDAKDSPFSAIIEDDNPVSAYENLLKLKSFLDRLARADEA